MDCFEFWKIGVHYFVYHPFLVMRSNRSVSLLNSDCIMLLLLVNAYIYLSYHCNYVNISEICLFLTFPCHFNIHVCVPLQHSKQREDYSSFTPQCLVDGSCPGNFQFGEVRYCRIDWVMANNKYHLPCEWSLTLFHFISWSKIFNPWVCGHPPNEVALKNET